MSSPPADYGLDNYSSPVRLGADGVAIDGFISTSGVANFLGLRYADIPGRFQPAVIKNLSGTLDATRYGPRCPQRLDGLQGLMANMFEKLSAGNWCDEFSCLHLNIYAPPDVLSSKKQFPVFAWIHGGGWNAGDNTTQFDGNYLVRRSMDLNQPIVVVAINYRLNIFGFISSRDLRNEASVQGNTPVINLGLDDQRLALKWIRSHIDLFGGDGLQVTLAGESAGAACVYYHLKSHEPLFHQAYIQSSPGPHLRSLEEAQRDFDLLARTAGINLNMTGPEKLSKLRSMSWQELVGHFNGQLATPIEDPNWFIASTSSTYSDDPEYWANIPSWCKRIIIGHTTDEASLFLEFLIGQPEANIIDFVQNAGVGFQLDPSSLNDPTQLLRQVSDAATLLAFTQPCINIALEAAKRQKKVYVHEVATTDPFESPLNGFAWHSIGNAILFYQPA